MSTPSSAIAQRPGASVVTPLAFPARYARFGTFQADVQREELYHDGERVRVQAKVFQGLLLLLSRAGEIVTREEVRCQLWPDTSLANLDANVNTTMNKLRQMLGDSPESPVFIETIPRRGYSFIAAVKFASMPEAPPTKLPGTSSEAASQSSASATAWSKKQVRTGLRVISLLLAGMILGALLAFVWFFAHGKNSRRAMDVKVSAALAEGKSQRNFC
jgi:DNA-binding winged helix-turn-helix (wHTH) protein